jgi:Flp pilus assembly protein TadG
VLLPFLMVLMTIINSALVLLAGQVLQTAATNAARLVMTGQAQNANDTAAQFKNGICTSTAVFAPFSANNAVVTLSRVSIDGNGNATISWSQSRPTGSQRSGNVTNLIPQGLLIANTSVIWGEATYNYKPVIGWVITGTLQMYDQIFLRPRQSTAVNYSTTSSCLTS